MSKRIFASELMFSWKSSVDLPCDPCILMCLVVNYAVGCLGNISFGQLKK